MDTADTFNLLNEVLKALEAVGPSVLISGIFLYAAVQLINIGLNYLRSGSKALRDTKDKPDPGAEIISMLQRAMGKANDIGVKVLLFDANAPNQPIGYVTFKDDGAILGLISVKKSDKGDRNEKSNKGSPCCP